MVDIIGTAGELTGIGQGGGGFNTGLVILVFVIAIIFMVVVSVGTILLIRWYQYKYKIVIFQRINGQFQETTRRKARVIPVGKGSDQAILLNKPAKILPMPSIQSGKNTFNYFISDDEEWINFRFGDFDKNRKEVGAQFLDKEMRYARTSLQRMGEDRYSAKGFWEKYGDRIMNAAVILILCIGLFLVLGKMIEFQQTASGTADTLQKVMDSANSILGKVDNINSGGTGLVQAET